MSQPGAAAKEAEMQDAALDELEEELVGGTLRKGSRSLRKGEYQVLTIGDLLPP